MTALQNPIRADATRPLTRTSTTRSRPEVSVVLTTFNRPATMARTLTGILRQREVDLEAVVVDNGSEDATAATLSAFTDPRLRVIRIDENRGGEQGRNTGLAAATGEVIAPVDDDDLWAPDKLRAQLDEMRRTGRGWSFTGCVYVDPALRVLGGVPPLPADRFVTEIRRRYVMPAGNSAVVWRRDLIDNAFDPALPHTSDWDLAMRLSRTGPPAVVSRPLVAYAQHTGNLSLRTDEMIRELAVLAAKHDNMRIDYSAQLLFTASQHLRTGDRRGAVKRYLRAAGQGNVGALARLPAVAVPRSLHPLLRRAFLSNRAWCREGERWLRELEAAMAATI